jgi:hypothetical protein
VLGIEIAGELPISKTKRIGEEGYECKHSSHRVQFESGSKKLEKHEFITAKTVFVSLKNVHSNLANVS